MVASEFKNLTEAQAAAKIGELCKKDYQTSGILASVSAAQMILESGYVKTELALNANNCFGMKCTLSGNTWSDSAWDGTSKYTKKTAEQKTDGTVYYITADFRKYSTIEDSIKDHSAYLNGAKNGSKLRYSGLKGETDYKKAIQIIKDGGYATDVSYVNKVCSIIEKYKLTQYDVLSSTGTSTKTSSASKGGTTVEIKQSILTKNPCYTAGKTITVKGLMLHSVGCSQPKAEVFINSWNSASYNNACVHAFIDGNTGVVYQTLPWNHRGWHCGSGTKGSGNNTHIGVEMCEPAGIKYTSGSSFTITDKTTAVACAKRTYESAVQLFAYLCKKYNLNPTSDGVIISHNEGHSRGIATNHGDPEHLWKGLGLSYTMDGFRKDVKSAMGTVSVSESKSTTTTTKTTTSTSTNKTTTTKTTSTIPSTPFTVKVTIDNLNIRKGPGTGYAKTGKYTGKGSFTITEVKSGTGATKGWGKLKSGAGWISLDYCTIV
jgi:hypothetical protein